MTARRWWGAARLVLGLLLLALVLSRPEAWHGLARLASTPGLMAALLAQCLLGAAIEAKRLTLLLRSQAISLSFARSLRLSLEAVPFIYMVPGGAGGDVMRAIALGGSYHQNRVEVAAVVLIDRLTGLASLLIVALVAALLSDSFVTAPAPLHVAAAVATLGLLVLLAGLAIAWSPVVRSARVVRFLSASARLPRLLSRTIGAVVAFREHKRALASAVLLTMIVHGALAVAMVLSARVLMSAAPAGIVAWVSLLAMVVNAVPITPGGLGVGEAAFDAAFQLLGFAGGARLLIAWRLAVLPFALLGGGLYILGGRVLGRRVPLQIGADRG